MKHLISAGTKFFAAILTIFFVMGILLGNPSQAVRVNAAYLTPRLIVTGSEITTGEVNAGDDFELLIHLKNESTSTKLNNIRIELTSEDNEIIPVNGTNVIYIDSMEKEEERDVADDIIFETSEKFKIKMFFKTFLALAKVNKSFFIVKSYNQIILEYNSIKIFCQVWKISNETPPAHASMVLFTIFIIIS